MVQYTGKPCSLTQKLQLIATSCNSQDSRETNWASSAETTQMLKEVVLSYRLLFAQDPKSRRLFDQLDAFEDYDADIKDPTLRRLCTNKVYSLPFTCVERDFYRLHRDFPILRSRIAILQQHMLRCKPKSWRQLWQDSRDSAQWWAFWAVIALGVIGVLLAIVQVALQAAQLARS